MQSSSCILDRSLRYIPGFALRPQWPERDQYVDDQHRNEVDDNILNKRQCAQIVFDEGELPFPRDPWCVKKEREWEASIQHGLHAQLIARATAKIAVRQLFRAEALHERRQERKRDRKHQCKTDATNSLEWATQHVGEVST